MNRYLLLTIITVISAILQLPQIQATVIWHATLIEQGEWWRILTGNFTHTNVTHLIMNMAALWIITYLFRPTASSLLFILISSAIFVGGSLLFDNLTIYAGLSGVLHSIFAYYALCEALSGRRSSWLLVIGVIAKIAYEQWFGPSSSTAALIEANVAIEAHLAGGVFGTACAILVNLSRKWSLINKPRK